MIVFLFFFLLCSQNHWPFDSIWFDIINNHNFVCERTKKKETGEKNKYAYCIVIDTRIGKKRTININEIYRWILGDFWVPPVMFRRLWLILYFFFFTFLMICNFYLGSTRARLKFIRFVAYCMPYDVVLFRQCAREWRRQRGLLSCVCLS